MYSCNEQMVEQNQHRDETSVHRKKTTNKKSLYEKVLTLFVTVELVFLIFFSIFAFSKVNDYIKYAHGLYVFTILPISLYFFFKEWLKRLKNNEQSLIKNLFEGKEFASNAFVVFLIYMFIWSTVILHLSIFYIQQILGIMDSNNINQLFSIFYVSIAIIFSPLTLLVFLSMWRCALNSKQYAYLSYRFFSTIFIFWHLIYVVSAIKIFFSLNN